MAMKTDKRNMTDATTNPIKGKPMRRRGFDTEKLCQLIDRRWGGNLPTFFKLLENFVPQNLPGNKKKLKPAPSLLNMWRDGSAPNSHYLGALADLLGVKVDDFYTDFDGVN